MLLLFLRAKVADDTTVCGPFVGRYLAFSDEETRISTLQVSNSLKETTNFVGETSLPHKSRGFMLDEMPVFQHLPGFLVNDRAEEMLRGRCGGVLLGGDEMGEGEDVTNRERCRRRQPRRRHSTGVRDHTVYHVCGAFVKSAAGDRAFMLGANMLLPAPPWLRRDVWGRRV